VLLLALAVAVVVVAGTTYLLRGRLVVAHRPAGKAAAGRGITRTRTRTGSQPRQGGILAPLLEDANPEESATFGPDRAAIADLVRSWDLAADDSDRARIETALTNHGVERIIVGPGAPLDPALHKVVGTADTTAVPPGSVLAVVRPGWRSIHGVIRPAEVSARAS
jgi:hypothetical protein